MGNPEVVHLAGKTLVLYRMRIVAEAVSVGRDLRAHSIKPFERGRPVCGRRVRYVNSIVGRNSVKVCPGLCCGAQGMNGMRVRDDC